MALSSDDKLFQQLEERHPDYKEWEGDWDRYRDVLGDSPDDIEKYLPKAEFEGQKLYDVRVELSQWIPESALPVKRLLGGLYHEVPKRDLKGQAKQLEDFLDRATRKGGKSFNRAVKEVARNLLGYGTIRVLVNVPAVKLEPGEIFTRMGEREAGLRPFLINYAPQSITDWSTDEDGELEFVRIREESTVKADPRDTLSKHIRQVKFIEYDRSEVRWWVFQEKKDKEMTLVSANPERQAHGIGIVPMVTMEIDDLKPLIGNSFIRYSSKADVRKLQAESDLAYDTYVHAHPFLAVWTEEELKDVFVGSNSYMKLNPGTGGVGREDAKYVDAPDTAFEALRHLVEDTRIQIFRQAQVDPMGQVVSGESTANFQASGVSRAWSFGTSEARTLSEIADVMTQVETRILDLALRWMDESKEYNPDELVFEGDIQYPQDFDPSTTAKLLEERESIALSVNSPTLLKIIDKRIASSKVGDASAKELKKIHDEIESNPLLGTQAGATKSPFDMPELPSLGAPPPKKDDSGGDVKGEKKEPKKGGNDGKA